MTGISPMAFRENNTITSVTIPGSVQQIGICAFLRCMSLSEVRLSDGLLEIGYSAFSGCPLRSISLPDSLLYVGESAFSGCTLLTSVRLPATAQVEYDSFYSTP